MENIEMHVIKRNGQFVPVLFDKILNRIKNLGIYDKRFSYKLSVNYSNLVIKVVDQLFDGITTAQIDELLAQQCSSLAAEHYDHFILAGRILVSNHQKKTEDNYLKIVEKSHKFTDVHGKKSQLISDEFYEIVKNHADEIQSFIDYNRDFLIDYFGWKTLERAYLMKINEKIIERPQHMWMRVAIGIHGNDMKKVKTTYDLMSQKYFTHATPTLFNAGTPRPQCSSCFLLAMENDSIGGIYKTLSDCAEISKWAGGIGLHIHNIRGRGSHIRGTNGTSNGIVPMLKVFNGTARYVDQGGGRRNGSFAIYLEPWHSDIESFLEMKKNHGDEDQRARDLFYALWIPDLFMKRVHEDGDWTLLCPDQCPGLSDCYGEEFEKLYEKYEKGFLIKKTISARKLWFKILDSQMETGTPYMLYKDACNKKSNQKNLGTIKSSNLCVAPETKILTDKGHIEIQTLKNKKVNVWNGKEYSEVVVKQTNDNSELITVKFSDGSELTCTKYHKFYIQTKYPTSKMKQDIIYSKSVNIIDAKNLKPDMKLIKCEYPVIDNNKNLKYAYTNGFFSGDGTYTNISEKEEKKCNFKSLEGKSYCKRHIDYQRNDEINEYCCGICYTKKPVVSLYGEKIKLLRYLDYRSVGKEKKNKLNVSLPVDLEEKFFVPSNYSLKSKLDWFAGYCDADGSIAKNGTNQSLQISCIHKNFLLKIKLMLQTCGITSKVTLNMNERLSYLPNGKGDMEYYKSKKLWRILIGSNDLQKLVKLGFLPKRLIIKKHNPQRNATQFVKVKEIIDNNRTDKTFCFNEPLRNAGIFNGVISSQCTEILEYSNEEQTAVCNLASVGLAMFVDKEKNYNYEELHKVVKVITDNLNKVIDINFYPTPKTKLSNFLHRPIGIGVQGLADTFAKMDIPFLSDKAKEINIKIFETIYHAALEQSCEMAQSRYENMEKLKEKKKHWKFMENNKDCREYILDGPPNNQEFIRELLKKVNPIKAEIDNLDQKLSGAYSSFNGSPASKGILQFDLWDIHPSKRYNWRILKNKIKEYGLRNSLLLAPMPTASTSQILGNNECFEPFTSLIYVRRTLAGEFVCVNKYMQKELIELGVWSIEMKNSIIKHQGSIQHIKEIPQHIRDKYKIVWEMPMKHILEMSRDRGAYIDQSQSLNLWVANPNYKVLTAIHFFGWKQGLKTGMYYLRTRAKAAPQQFTIEPTKIVKKPVVLECLSCGS